MSYNKRGSPRKLGRPRIGQSRHPTANECEICGLRRSDLIISGSQGLFISRLATSAGGRQRELLPLSETQVIAEDLEEFWSR